MLPNHTSATNKNAEHTTKSNQLNIKPVNIESVDYSISHATRF